MEVGSIIAYSSITLPEGYLVCDGSAVSRSTYSDLFDVIGTTYGPGDGSTTFNLPNLSGNVAVGSSSGYILGASGGEYSHEITLTELAEHDHVVPLHGHANTIAAKVPELTHSITQPVVTYTALNSSGSRYGAQYSRSVYKNKTTSSMTRSTNVYVYSHTATNCTMSGSVTDCGAMTTSAFGSTTVNAHDNMMPYLAVLYIIKYEPDVHFEHMLMFNGCMPCAPSGAYLKGRK